jgi:hypothetical protein
MLLPGMASQNRHFGIRIEGNHLYLSSNDEQMTAAIFVLFSLGS